MDRKLPTSGQIERNLSQRIQKLYREQLGHSPRKVTCKLFDNRLVVVIEDSLTILQKTLFEKDNKDEIARYVNLAIDNAIESKLKIAIEEVLGIEVYDILFDSSLKSQQSGAIVILTQAPLVRSRELTPTIRKSQFKDKYVKDGFSQADGNSLDKYVKDGFSQADGNSSDKYVKDGFSQADGNSLDKYVKDGFSQADGNSSASTTESKTEDS